MKTIEISVDVASIGIRPSGYSPEISCIIEISETEADTIFDDIKESVDHDEMMKCLDEAEVREYFGIEEEDNA